MPNYRVISPMDQWLVNDDGDIIGARRRRIGGTDFEPTSDSALVAKATATPTSSDTVLGVQGGVVKRFAQRDLGPVVPITRFGASPTASGAANLAACEAAVAALPSTGGVVLIPGIGEFTLSDSWNIRRSNVIVYNEAGATLKTVAATTYGQTLGFVEGTAYGGSDAAQIENSGVIGGGKVIATGSGGADNAIGFTRCKNWFCIGQVVTSDRFGITAQVNVDDGLIAHNVIESSTLAAIAVISASAATGQKDRRNRILHNIVRATDSYGIYADYFDWLEVTGNIINSTGRSLYIIGQAGDLGKTLVGSGNVLSSSGDYAVWLDYLDGIDLHSFVKGGAGGVLAKRSTDVRLRGSVKAVTGAASLTLDTITGTLDCDMTLMETPADYIAVSAASVPAVNSLRLTVEGSHTYVFTTTGQALNVSGSSLETGSTGLYSGTTPHAEGLFVDGAAYVIPQPATAWADADTTPSVANKKTFTTANTGATSVTNFDGGVDGQTIVIYAADNNTTLKHASGGGNIRNQKSGGVDKLLATGNVYSYLNVGGLWYEI